MPMIVFFKLVRDVTGNTLSKKKANMQKVPRLDLKFEQSLLYICVLGSVLFTSCKQMPSLQVQMDAWKVLGLREMQYELLSQSMWYVVSAKEQQPWQSENRQCINCLISCTLWLGVFSTYAAMRRIQRCESRCTKFLISLLLSYLVVILDSLLIE